MSVWIVIEEDRGMGPTISGVYLTEAAAKAACGSHEYVDGPHQIEVK